uniref:Uncharacterized protein n=1 Tax=Siphoviridae sp. ctNEy24 TaxID=2825466 RepID=A0A8S5U0M3_9CAUD|nr:MAG TPA: hypothetical protein [Siphoviridae sp. ctNEy24]
MFYSSCVAYAGRDSKPRKCIAGDNQGATIKISLRARYLATISYN